MSGRKKKVEGAINTEGWMMSYADMATILLAMFIVLSTLGKDQTGLSLQHATGSFVRSLHSYGLPGLFSHASKPVTLTGPSPHYLYSPPADGGEGGGPDNLRVIDADEEHLRRFVHELQRQFTCRRRPRQAGQVVIDLYEPLRKEAPYLTARHNEVLHQVAPLLNRPDYRAELVVWATTPAATAWARAVQQASLAAEEFAADNHVEGDARMRLTPVGRPWPFRDVRRPVLSVVLAKQS
jgi:hypothetical protein